MNGQEEGFKDGSGPRRAWSSTLTSDEATGSKEQGGGSSRAQSCPY